jgi:hypothetical protein
METEKAAGCGLASGWESVIGTKRDGRRAEGWAAA